MKTGFEPNFKVIFEPRDVWIGCYWDWKREPDYTLTGGFSIRRLYLYFCLVPMVVFRVIVDV